MAWGDTYHIHHAYYNGAIRSNCFEAIHAITQFEPGWTVVNGIHFHPLLAIESLAD